MLPSWVTPLGVANSSSLNGPISAARPVVPRMPVQSGMTGVVADPFRSGGVLGPVANPFIEAEGMNEMQRERQRQVVGPDGKGRRVNPRYPAQADMHALPFIDRFTQFLEEHKS